MCGDGLDQRQEQRLYCLRKLLHLVKECCRCLQVNVVLWGLKLTLLPVEEDRHPRSEFMTTVKHI